MKCIDDNLFMYFYLQFQQILKFQVAVYRKEQTAQRMKQELCLLEKQDPGKVQLVTQY